MLLVSKILNTDGSGYWSNVRENVPITGLDLGYVNEDGTFGELRVYFDTKVWDVNHDGLIYTDKLFLHELKHFLVSLRLAGDDVGYSEQGMQGDNYVSLDVGYKFIQSFQALKA
jgi:hypothetical protein